MSPVRPIRELSTPVDLLNHFGDLLRLLDELCSDPGLVEIRTKRPQHPAIPMYDSIASFVKTGRIPTRNEFQYVRSATRLNLDRMTWASNIDNETALSQLIDQPLLDFVIRRSRNSDTFEDIGAELYFWGWLRTQGFQARMVEQEGLPDIEVQGPSNFWCEVKRIKSSSSADRVQAVLKKANKQIKKADPSGVGVVFIHIDRDLSPETLADDLPGDIADRISQIRRTLSGAFCRSVGLVVAAWDEVSFTRPEPPGVQHFVSRRKSVILKHANPRSESPVEPNRLQVGMTAIWRLKNPIITEVLTEESHRELGGDSWRIHFSGTFRRFNRDIERIDERHVATALGAPESIAHISIHDVVMFIALKTVALKSQTYVMLILGYRNPGHILEVNDAYRVHVDNEKIGSLITDPIRVFNQFVDKFGVLVQVGDAIGKFIPYATDDIEAAEDFSFVKFPYSTSESDMDVEVRAPFSASRNGARVEVVGLYGINLRSYRSALKRRANML